ncbi:ABC transporter permease [uncultured Actinomyces sp.]|uniref:ABC transporter permease n=1 Tax=uncultured Actinomyces sp. TaxID=249061 RepID=UPI0025F1E420|nr:ABC transporter permease [uncultured Actinomyces sp.]
MSPTPLSTSNLPTSTRPADRTAWTPAAARLRASVRAAWYWENRKAPNRWYWGAVTALCTLSSLSGYLQYRTYQNELQPQGITWDALWPHSTLPLSMWLLPLVLSVFAAQIAAGERQGDGWRRMRANHLETIMIVGKLLHGLQVAVATTAILVLTTAITGLLAGFSLLGLAAYLPRFGTTVLGMWVILTFITWLGVLMRSFTTTIITAVLGTIAGTAMLLTAHPLSVLIPMTALPRATAPLDPGAMTSPGSAAIDGLVCLMWVAALALALLQTVRRR